MVESQAQCKFHLLNNLLGSTPQLKVMNSFTKEKVIILLSLNFYIGTFRTETP